MKVSQILIFLMIVLTVAACSDYSFVKKNKVSINQALNTIEPIEAVGYSSMDQYANYPPSQQRLMAIRAAKLDAYRNIAEELYGVKIKGNTTVKDLTIQSDSYRVYVNGLLRGIHVQTVTPKGKGVYEAEVVLNIDKYRANCLYYPHHACFNKDDLSRQSELTSPSVQYFSK